MPILKYLDILIGLAVVMVLLSPAVSAITQLWMWLSNTRAGRLQVGLKRLLLHLDCNTYDVYDKAVVAVAGLPAGTVLAGNGFPPDPGTVVGVNREFTNNISGRLKAGNGSLTFNPPPGAV